MKFEMWSIWHILYIFSSFIMFGLIYFLVRKKNDKVKNIVGYVLGMISVAILIIRNIDIYIRSGMDLEVIPLQVCHIGSLIAGFALIFKKKWLLLTSFCFNLVPAILAMVFADSLANYETLLAIRPQTYVWGHIFIVVCALYGILIFRPMFEKKDLIYSMVFIGIMCIIAIICNSLFRHLFEWNANYFYLFDYKGTPLKFLYNVFPSSVYGWFEINWFYVIVLISFFIFVFIGLYFISKYIIRKLKN